MKLYHGTNYEKAEQIIAAGQYRPGFGDNPWSAAHDEGGLFCSDVLEYAAQYGPALVEIIVDRNKVLWIQDCPIDENDYGWQPEFANAGEYLIPEGIAFTARMR